MKEKIKALFKEYYNDETMPAIELEDKVLALFDVVGRSEQLVSFLRQYQKSCEIMHVGKIDAKNFVEQYKTN